MEQNTCPRCGWPLAELPRTSVRSQPVSGGNLEYVRCVCGSWLARVDGVVIGATKSQLGPAQL
jgi:hypothetical protein